MKSIPTLHFNYKVIDFAPNNKSITVNKLPLINWERILRRIKSILRVNSEKYIARYLSKICQNSNL